eukprot:GILI01023708.1.p1 GENE.GILI01023708.1~~GILI01023708.1.p1  ORF type:complete len:359 (+),score=75.32 GILI01023708.1:47-1123(+)
MLKFKGAANFRQRIVCAALSGKSIRIDDIRAEEDFPGIKDYEANFLQLVDKITNGSRIEISETGTTVKFRPGIIVGGDDLEHDCGTERAISYFIEGIIGLAPFAKNPLSITLRGITNDDVDISVDTVRTVTLPLLKHFGVEEGLDLKIKKRGAPPLGGGEVLLTVPVVKSLRSIQLLDEGKFKRIRGVAYCTRVSPQTSNRMVESARGLLNDFIPDVWVFTDHFKGKDSGLSPGFGCSLVAESTSGILMSAESAARTDASVLPEDVGLKSAELLLEEIAKGGCVDTTHQWLMLHFMVLSPEDVSKIRLGKLSPYCIQYLRHIRDFFGVVFKIRPDPSNGTVLLSCLGIGYKNIARKTF